jgi:hypothetical protein
VPSVAGVTLLLLATGKALRQAPAAAAAAAAAPSSPSLVDAFERQLARRMVAVAAAAGAGGAPAAAWRVREVAPTPAGAAVEGKALAWALEPPAALAVDFACGAAPLALAVRGGVHLPAARLRACAPVALRSLPLQLLAPLQQAAAAANDAHGGVVWDAVHTPFK